MLQFKAIQNVNSSVTFYDNLKGLCGTSVLCWKRVIYVSGLHFENNVSYSGSLSAERREALRRGTGERA